jgi:hypothetical protein
VALSPDLVQLAEVEPDANFVADVLADTRALVARRVPWDIRLRAAWERLLLRPRLAWEFATAGCFLLMLLCGMPFSPLRQMPRQALAMIQIFPTGLVEKADREVRPFWNEYAPRAWDGSGGRLVRRGREMTSEFGAEHAEAAVAWQSLGLHMDELGAATKSRNFAQASHAMHAIQIDLTALWHGLRGQPAGQPRGDSQPSEPQSEDASNGQPEEEP